MQMKLFRLVFFNLSVVNPNLLLTFVANKTMHAFLWILNSCSVAFH